MPTVHDLRSRRRELLDDLEAIETQLADLNSRPEGGGDALEEEAMQRQEHRIWLQRQQASALVFLQEAERALLGFNEDAGEDS